MLVAMQSYRTEGIILQTLNFQDFDLIASVFTPSGLIKLIIKGANHTRRNPSKPAPLTFGEFVYTQGKSELFKCTEFSIIKQFPAIRTSLPALEAACDVLQAIIESQLPHKPAPDLYLLLLWTLSKLPSCTDPHALSSSFRLKLLKHEGLLKLQLQCSVCEKSLLKAFIASGETFCQEHAPHHNLSLNEEEVRLLSGLLEFLTFSDVATVQLPLPLREKLKILFTQLLH